MQAALFPLRLPWSQYRMSNQMEAFHERSLSLINTRGIYAFSGIGSFRGWPFVQLFRYVAGCEGERTSQAQPCELLQRTRPGNHTVVHEPFPDLRKIKYNARSLGNDWNFAGLRYRPMGFRMEMQASSSKRLVCEASYNQAALASDCYIFESRVDMGPRDGVVQSHFAAWNGRRLHRERATSDLDRRATRSCLFWFCNLL